MLILFIYVACLDTCKCLLTFVYQLVFIPIKLFIHSLFNATATAVTVRVSRVSGMVSVRDCVKQVPL